MGINCKEFFNAFLFINSLITRSMNFFKRHQEKTILFLALIGAPSVGLGFIPFYREGWCQYLGFCIQISLDDEELVRTALALAGAVLVFSNMILIVIRTGQTKKQLKKAEEQIEESHESNFVNALNQATDMLYADSYVRQVAGVEHLHYLAKTYEDRENERVQRVLDILCCFVRSSPNRETMFLKEGEREKTKVRNEEIREIKTKILAEIIGNKEHVFYHERRKDLRGAQIRGKKVRCITTIPLSSKEEEAGKDSDKKSVFDGPNPKKVSLSEINLEDVVLSNANLQGAFFDGVNLSRATLKEVDLQWAVINESNLSETGLEGAKLEHCLFSCVDLREAKLMGRREGVSHKSDPVRLVGVDLRNCEPTGINRDHMYDLGYSFIDEGSEWEGIFSEYVKSSAKGFFHMRWTGEEFECAKADTIRVCKGGKRFRWSGMNPEVKSEEMNQDELIEKLKERFKKLGISSMTTSDDWDETYELRQTSLFYPPHARLTGKKVVEHERLEKKIIAHVIDYLRNGLKNYL